MAYTRKSFTKSTTPANKSTTQANKLSVAERLRRRATGSVAQEALKKKLAAQKAARLHARSTRDGGNAGLRKKYGGLTGIRQDLKR